MLRVCREIPRAFFTSKQLFLALVLCCAGLMAFGQDGGSDGDGAVHRADSPEKHGPETEWTWIGHQTIGHVEINVSSKWTELATSGVEMDRHIWGHKLGARLDYSSEFLPVMILRQRSKTDIWGNPKTQDMEILYGIGLSPIGARLRWRDDKNFRPYFMAKGGMAVFDKKAMSQYASYELFTLQFEFGSQFRLSPRLDGRVGIKSFHMSNAFIVPSNPGMDSFGYTFGVTYHPGARRQ